MASHNVYEVTTEVRMLWWHGIWKKCEATTAVHIYGDGNYFIGNDCFSYTYALK